MSFDEALEIEINKLPYTKGLDDGQYNDGVLSGFELGAYWAYNKALEDAKGRVKRLAVNGIISTVVITELEKLKK